jgi:hypothetical protein
MGIFIAQNTKMEEMFQRSYIVNIDFCPYAIDCSMIDNGFSTDDDGGNLLHQKIFDGHSLVLDSDINDLANQVKDLVMEWIKEYQ